MTIANITNSLLFPFFFLKRLNLEENLPNLFHNLQHQHYDEDKDSTLLKSDVPRILTK